MNLYYSNGALWCTLYFRATAEFPKRREVRGNLYSLSPFFVARACVQFDVVSFKSVPHCTPRLDDLRRAKRSAAPLGRLRPPYKERRPTRGDRVNARASRSESGPVATDSSSSGRAIKSVDSTRSQPRAESDGQQRTTE